jgi:hypothetical protein
MCRQALHSGVMSDTVIETKPANPKADEWAERIAASPISIHGNQRSTVFQTALIPRDGMHPQKRSMISLEGIRRPQFTFCTVGVDRRYSWPEQYGDPN